MKRVHGIIKMTDLVWLLLISATIPGILSCSDRIDIYAENPTQNLEDGGKLNIDIELHTPGNQRETPTRSAKLDDDIENLISEVAVLLFYADASGNPDKLIEILQPNYLDRDENDNTLYHANFTTFLTGDIKSHHLRIGILANADTQLEKLTDSEKETDDIKFSDIRRLLTESIADDSTDLLGDFEPKLPTPDGAPFVMWGLPDNIIKAEGDASFTIECCLMRSLARFDVELSETLKGSGLFDFRSVHFYKPSTTIVHIPDNSNISGTTDETGHPYYFTSSTTLSDDNTVFHRWDYAESVEDGKFEYTCYVPEGEVVMNGINGGKGKPRDANHIMRPAVIVGGYYNGSNEMSYYRIDICDNEGNLIDILRNHQYLIRIRSVLGPGQPTPDEAYDNRNVCIVAEITDWCLVQSDVMYYGAEWITVTQRVIDLTGNAGSGTTFIINSSVPLDEWEFKLGEDGDFSQSQLLESENFFVTRPIEEKGSKILVVTKHDLNAGAQPVSERLYVRIGNRVLFYITINQYPLSDDNWFVGEYIAGNKGPWVGVINFPIGGADPDIPTGSFIDFLRWLFGGDYSGGIGEGDNYSPTDYIDYIFFDFISWFFTDEYGHLIGGTLEEWNEEYKYPIGILMYDFMKWMLGPEFHREIEGPDVDPYDPSRPETTTVGALITMRLLEWLKVQDFLRELEGITDKPYDPENPEYTSVGSEVIMQFISWFKTIDFTGFLEGANTSTGSGDDKEENDSGSFDSLMDFFNWYVGTSIQKFVGGEETPDDPDIPANPEIEKGDIPTDFEKWDENHEINKDLFHGEEYEEEIQNEI